MTLDDPIPRLNTALQGRYRIERQLGEGGMASVYLAEDLKHHRKVALKVLKPDLAAVVGASRFLAEIETTANLTHPNILPLHDSGEARSEDGGPGFVYFVMPYVEDESLRERLDRENQLPVDEAVRIAVEVAEALDHAHRQGVIHRDIKPANILLREGRPLVADFGIALAASRSGGGERLTETGMSLGTPHYMSPEQATGDASLGPATDIYALGCVLYEMLVGEPPFTGRTPQAVLGRIITGEVPTASEERSSVPPHVDGVIRKALEKLPADRFRSAGEFGGALADEGFRYGEEPPAGVTEGLGARKWALAAATLLLGLLLGYALRPGSEESSSAPAAAHLQVVLPSGVFLPLDSDYPLLAVSPDGSRIVFVGEMEGRRQLYSRLLGDSASRAIPGTEGALAPFFSSDGEWIGFLSGSLIYRVATAGGAPIPTHGITGEGVNRGASWVSDTTLVYVASANSGLLKGTISETRVGQWADWDSLTTVATPAAWPAPVSGTMDVLFARSSPDSRESDIGLFSMDYGEERTLIRGARSPRFSSTGHLLFARGSALHGVRYDPGRRETDGAEREVIRGVILAGFDVSHYAVGSGVLAYVAGGEVSRNSELVWVDRSGEVVEVLHEARQYAGPRLSPDGRRVAVTVTEGPNLDVWMLDLARNTLQPLTRHPGEDFEPQWRPDGRSLALASEVGEDRGEGGPVLAWIPELGGPTEQLLSTPEAGAWEMPTSWTPDGRSIVVTTRRQGQSADIALVHLDGDPAPVPLVDTPADEVGATISPDGEWLAFVSNASGRDEVWVRPFPGPGTSVQISSDGGLEPVWSPDSREIFYRSGLDMMAVEITPGPEPAINPPRRLFAGRFERNRFGGNSANFDVSRDGSRFLMIRRSESVQPTVIHVVLDWPSILFPTSDANSP